MNINIKNTVTLLLLFLALRGMVGANVTVYPVPNGIAINPDFTVRINDGSGWVPVPVQDIVDSCFIHFETSGAVEVEVNANRTITSHQISPLSAGITSRVNDSKLTFTLSKPQKLIVLINEGAGNHNTGLDGLMVFAEAPETDVPSLNDSSVVNIMSYGVDNTGKLLNRTQIQKAFDDHADGGKIIYFPPGIYKTGMLHMRSKQSLYLAPGATLLGSSNFADYDQIAGEGFSNEHYVLGSWNARNIKVYGRGIVNGNGSALRLQDPSGSKFKTHNIQFMGTNHIEMKDIISLDAGSWSIEPIYCDHVTIENIKILSDLRYYGSAKLNTDGFDINKCRHVLIEDSFVWACDDAITPKQDKHLPAFPYRDLYDLKFRDMIIYSRKCAFKIGSETRGQNYKMSDVTFEDSDIVVADRAFAIWSDEGMRVENIVFRDIRIEKTYKDVKQNHINFRIDAPGGSIKNISFINVAAREPAPRGSVFEGNNLGAVVNGNTVQFYNIHFENYTIGGELVTGLDDKKAKFSLNNDTVGANPDAFSFSGPSSVSLPARKSLTNAGPPPLDKAPPATAGD